VRCTLQPGLGTRYIEDAAACDAVVLGSLIQSLVKSGLYPLPLPETYTGTVNNLLYDLEALPSGVRYLKMVDYHDEHASCNPGPALMQDISSAYNSRQPMVTEKHKMRFKQQAEKTGVYNVF
jgi:hypothetical protein